MDDDDDVKVASTDNVQVQSSQLLPFLVLAYLQQVHHTDLDVKVVAEVVDVHIEMAVVVEKCPFHGMEE